MKQNEIYDALENGKQLWWRGEKRPTLRVLDAQYQGNGVWAVDSVDYFGDRWFERVRSSNLTLDEPFSGWQQEFRPGRFGFTPKELTITWPDEYKPTDYVTATTHHGDVLLDFKAVEWIEVLCHCVDGSTHRRVIVNPTVRFQHGMWSEIHKEIGLLGEEVTE